MNFKNIKLIVLDVDGVLTDGKLHIGSDGEEYKSFNVKDGMGISIGKFAGIQFAIITGRKSEAVSKRAKELGIEYVYQGISDKKEILNELSTTLGITFSEICYMGDDLNDLPIIKSVGLTFAPNDAVNFVKNQVDFVTGAKGGDGAVREMIDKILGRKEDYEKLVDRYLHYKYAFMQ